jgi:CheY-specific phosphatase CheX
MDNDKLSSFISCVSDAFVDISTELAGLKFIESRNENINRDKTFSVIIGVLGKYDKGRILFETGATVVNAITESINDEPEGNIMEKYLSIAEFVNIYCGRAVTLLNNKYRGSDLRLTPPAIFVGSRMEITTPDIKTTTIFFKCMRGTVSVDVGFEQCHQSPTS